MKTAILELRNIKSADGWHILATELDLSEEQREKYFEFGEYASIKIFVVVTENNLEIVGGCILPLKGSK